MVRHQQPRRDQETRAERCSLSAGHIDPDASNRSADAQSLLQKRHPHQIVCAEDAFEYRVAREALRLARHQGGRLLDYRFLVGVDPQSTTRQKFLDTVWAVYVEIALLLDEPLIALSLRPPFCETLRGLVQLKVADQHESPPDKYPAGCPAALISVTHLQPEYGRAIPDPL